MTITEHLDNLLITNGGITIRVRDGVAARARVLTPSQKVTGFDPRWSYLLSPIGLLVQDA